MAASMACTNDLTCKMPQWRVGVSHAVTASLTWGPSEHQSNLGKEGQHKRNTSAVDATSTQQTEHTTQGCSSTLLLLIQRQIQACIMALQTHSGPVGRCMQDTCYWQCCLVVWCGVVWCAVLGQQGLQQQGPSMGTLHDTARHSMVTWLTQLRDPTYKHTHKHMASPSSKQASKRARRFNHMTAASRRDTAVRAKPMHMPYAPQ
jgi:hypothetical protein